jgi:hypothetical protein
MVANTDNENYVVILQIPVLHVTKFEPNIRHSVCTSAELETSCNQICSKETKYRLHESTW